MPLLADNKSFFSNNFRSITFTDVMFEVVPSFLASLASYNGSDNSHLRFQELGVDRVSVKIEEDTTMDEEMGHASENISFLAIGGTGSLSAFSTPLADGLTRTYSLDIIDQGTISDLDVNLDLVHDRVQDLDIFLEAPDGTIVELLTDVGESGNDLTATKLDDEAITTISSGSPPYSGNFQPEGALRDFDGKDVTGTWVLQITDDEVNRVTGVLLDWSLDIELRPEPEGNLNYDSHMDATDIDLLFAKQGSGVSTFDLDSDGNVDRQDLEYLVQNLMGKRFGDADLDQKVDMADFNTVSGQYDPVGGSGFKNWNNGNFDADDDIDFNDAMRVVLNFASTGYSSLGATMQESLLANGMSVVAGPATAPSLHSGTQLETDAKDATSPADIRQERDARPVELHEPQNNHVSKLYLADDFRSKKRGRRANPDTST